MKMIQTRSLPSDWLQQVNKFVVEKSSLSRNNKIIADTLIEFIKVKRKSLFLILWPNCLFPILCSQIRF